MVANFGQVKQMNVLKGFDSPLVIKPEIKNIYSILRRIPMLCISHKNQQFEAKTVRQFMIFCSATNL